MFRQENHELQPGHVACMHPAHSMCMHLAYIVHAPSMQVGMQQACNVHASMYAEPMQKCMQQLICGNFGFKNLI